MDIEPEVTEALPETAPEAVDVTPEDDPAPEVADIPADTANPVPAVISDLPDEAPLAPSDQPPQPKPAPVTDDDLVTVTSRPDGNVEKEPAKETAPITVHEKPTPPEGWTPGGPER